MSIGEKTLAELLVLAQETIKEAAHLALNPQLLPNVKAAGGLAIETKSNRNDLVTLVDRGIEDFVAAKLAQFSDYPLVGEEAHTVDSYQGRIWVLDPIDGTMNYVATHRDYAISLALCEDGNPVLAIIADVVAGKFYTAIKGEGAYCNGEPLEQINRETTYQDTVLITDMKEMVALPRLLQILQESRGHRRYGSAALECVEVAAGQAGGFIHMWVSPWDIAAATLICEETGVKVTRIDGTPLDIRYKGSILAGWPGVHQSLLERLMIASNI